MKIPVDNAAAIGKVVRASRKAQKIRHRQLLSRCAEFSIEQHPVQRNALRFAVRTAGQPKANTLRYGRDGASNSPGKSNMDTRRLGIIGLGKKACLDLHQLLDVFNSSSGVNFATQNRFPKIVGGAYLESGLSSKLMTKDVVLYIDLVRTLGVASLNASGPLAPLPKHSREDTHVELAVADLRTRVRFPPPTM